MANWGKNVRQVKFSRGNDRRFLTSLDMSEAKRALSIINSRIKRGEIKRTGFGFMRVCGCGSSGCMIVGEI